MLIARRSGDNRNALFEPLAVEFLLCLRAFPLIPVAFLLAASEADTVLRRTLFLIGSLALLAKLFEAKDCRHRMPSVKVPQSVEDSGSGSSTSPALLRPPPLLPAGSVSVIDALPVGLPACKGAGDP